MKFHIFLLFILIFVCACSKTDKLPDNIEKTLIVNPQQALKTLDSIDTLSLSETQKDRRALLQVYTATIWNNTSDISSADMHRATTAYTGKCNTLEVKSLIIQSEEAKTNCNPIARLELLKDAEFLAAQLGDKSDLAFVYLYLSQAYANGYNGLVSQHYANKSLQLFNELGYKKQSIDARMAIAGAIAVKRDYATLLDSLLAMRSDVMAHSDTSYQTFFLDQLARALDENIRSEEAIALWHSIYDFDIISSNTLAHIARAYTHVNKLDSAETLIKKAIELPHNNTDEYLCRNVEYDIIERLGRESELPAIDSLRNKAANMDYGERRIAESSLALNNKYDSATQSAWMEIQANKQRTVVLISTFVITLLALIGGILFYRKRSQLLKVENENNLLKLQNLEHNLFEKERLQSVIIDKVFALFKSRFQTIDNLANAYFECKETPQEQKRIFTEAKSAIEKFSTDSSIHELENIINSTNDNLMQHFDEDFPKLSASQRKLAIFIFCGFSLQSISIFLGKDLRNIYVYKSRLKSTISKSNSCRQDLYLAYFK